MSAITAALSQIDRVATEGDLAPDPAAPLELETAGEPILLPDGKRIHPPCLHGQPIYEFALALLDMDDPARSTLLRPIGPPGAGKSQIAQAIAYRLWTGRGRGGRATRRGVLVNGESGPRYSAGRFEPAKPEEHGRRVPKDVRSSANMTPSSLT